MNVSVARTLAAAYPPPVRRRWGAAIAAEIACRGAGGWVDSLAGAVRLWARPGQWPAASGRHARRAVVVLAVLTAGLTALGARGMPSHDLLVASPGVAVALGLILLGLLVLAPVPRATRASLIGVTRAVAVPLVVPCALLAVVFYLADSGIVLHGVAHAFGVVLYWVTLAGLALAPAVAALRIDPDHAVIPGRQRAMAGLAVLGTGLALTGLVAISRRTDLGALTYGIAQLGLTALTGASILDLHRSRPSAGERASRVGPLDDVRP